MIFKPIKLTILFSLALCMIVACKSQKVKTNEYSLLIELKKEISIAEVKTLENHTIVNSNRSNRTLNQWVIQVSSTVEQEQMITDLKKDEMVISVQSINQKPNSITTSTNEKKGKGKPSGN